MGLEFKINAIGGVEKLHIDAQDTIGDKVVWFTIIDSVGNTIDFDVLSLKELLGLGVYVNHKIGFSLFNIWNIEQQIEEEIKLEKGGV